MDNTNIQRVLTINEAAKHYPGFTPSAIRRLVKNGEIPSRKVGVKYLITPEAIENWLKGAGGELNDATRDNR